MQRQIKFRGQRVGGEWAFGLLCNKNDKWFISNSVGEPTAYEIRPETIGQFTGLLDKNGKEIYEGDIVKCVFEKTEGEKEPLPDFFTEVRWHSVQAGFWPFVLPTLSHKHSTFHRPPIGGSFAGKVESYEVLDDIWENPGSLK